MSTWVLSTAATGLPRPAWGTPSIAALPRGFPTLKSKRAHAVGAALPPRLPCHPPTCPSALCPSCSRCHCRLRLNATSCSTRWKASSSPLSKPCGSLLPSSTSPQSSGKFYTFSNCLVSASPQRDYHFSEARTLALFGVSAEGSAYSSVSGTCRNK